MTGAADIADAVVSELNAGEFSWAFTAVKAYRPEYELKDLTTLRVTVVPREASPGRLSRSVRWSDYRIDIGVQKKVSSDAEADALMDLVEEIDSYLHGRTLAGCPDAIWVGSEISGAPAEEHLRDWGVFTALVSVTYRVLK